jgi:hypothetical protein
VIPIQLYCTDEVTASSPLSLFQTHCFAQPWISSLPPEMPCPKAGQGKMSSALSSLVSSPGVCMTVSLPSGQPETYKEAFI